MAPEVLAVVVALVRLPFLLLPLSPDEGGYLLVASQWAPGSSTYGDYFVDRPPLLMGLFGLADALGGAVPLRLLGLLAAVARGAARRSARRMAACGDRGGLPVDPALRRDAGRR